MFILILEPILKSLKRTAFVGTIIFGVLCFLVVNGFLNKIQNMSQTQIENELPIFLIMSLCSGGWCLGSFGIFVMEVIEELKGKERKNG